MVFLTLQRSLIALVVVVCFVIFQVEAQLPQQQQQQQKPIPVLVKKYPPIGNQPSTLAEFLNNGGQIVASPKPPITYQGPISGINAQRYQQQSQQQSQQQQIHHHQQQQQQQQQQQNRQNSPGSTSSSLNKYLRGPPQQQRNPYEQSLSSNHKQQSYNKSPINPNSIGNGNRKVPYGSGGVKVKYEDEIYDDEELEDENKPDRLTLLLKESKFTCAGKKDGYFADESLQCEVFHYCQDGGKHSWMCPNSFAFHQVHLICLPHSSDNICKQSSNYHFVNEYLYRPINEKQALATNSSLRYADRYYPENYTPGMAFNEMYEEGSAPHAYLPKAPPSLQRYYSSGDRDQQVFYSPEQVNIPLNLRRPSVIRPAPSTAIKQKTLPPAQHSAEYEYYDD